MPSGSRRRAEQRRKRVAWTFVISAVIALSLVAFALTRADNTESTAVPPPVTTSTGAFTFGGATSTTVFGENDLTLPFIQRLPMKLNQDALRFRVHVANQNLRLDEAIPGVVEVGGIWMAPDKAEKDDPDPTGELGELPIQIFPETDLLDGEEYVGPWIESSRYTLDKDQFHLVSVAASFNGLQPVVTTFSGSWISAGQRSIATQTEPGEWSNGISLLDIWIEYEYEGEAPSLLVYGSSLSTPGNGGPEPTYGEPTAWPQRWARLVDGIALNNAVSMGTIDHYVSETRLTSRFANIVPSAVVMWTASNSLGRGDDYDQVHSDTQATIDRLRKTYPDTVIVLATEPGRNDFVIPDEYYQNRMRYNDWVRSVPDGADGFIDLDALLSDPDDNHFLSDSYDSGDLVHLNEAGHIAVSELVAETLRELGV